jgi:hypothetical protein
MREPRQPRAVPVPLPVAMRGPRSWRQRGNAGRDAKVLLRRLQQAQQRSDWLWLRSACSSSPAILLRTCARASRLLPDPSGCFLSPTHSLCQSSCLPSPLFINPAHPLGPSRLPFPLACAGVGGGGGGDGARHAPHQAALPHHGHHPARVPAGGPELDDQPARPRHLRCVCTCLPARALVFLALPHPTPT